MNMIQRIAKDFPKELSETTGISAETFLLIAQGNYKEAFELSPKAFAYYHKGEQSGEEFEFPPDIIPYLDGTLEWNATTERFEGCFWGEVELPGYKLLGWITIDASYADNYQPIQYEVHDVIDLETGESDPDHSLFGKILMVADTLMKVDYEI